MNKKNLFIILAVCLTGTFTSCGDKNEKAINKYEKLVKKANEETDITKKTLILSDATNALNDIKEEDLTTEQRERILRISASAAGSSFGNMEFE